MNTLAAKLGMKAVVFKVTDKGKQQGSGQVRISHQRGFFSSNLPGGAAGTAVAMELVSTPGGSTAP
jgi:hypothetical protein